MRSIPKLLALAALVLSNNAWACGTKPISESSRFSIVNDRIGTSSKYQIYAEQNLLDAAPSWKPGDGEMPLSTAQAFDIVSKWAADSPTITIKPAEVWSVEIRGCPQETLFRYFLFELRGGPYVAVLFDGTLLTEVREQTVGANTAQPTHDKKITPSYSELLECPFLLTTLEKLEALQSRFSENHPDVLASTRESKLHTLMCRYGKQPVAQLRDEKGRKIPFEFNGETFFIVPLAL